MTVRTERAVRAAAAALAIGAAGAVLGSCAKTTPKTSPTSSSSSSSTSSSSTSTSSTTTSTTSPVSTSSSTTSTTATTTTCQLSQLRILRSGSEGAAGTIELTFSLENTSNVLCTMYGYPGMLLLDASGGALPTKVVRGGGLAFENVAPANVSLAPGQTAYFNLGYNDVITSNGCSSASQVEITPPNDTAHVVVASSIDACGGGNLNVSAVFASTNTAAMGTTAP